VKITIKLEADDIRRAIASYVAANPLWNFRTLGVDAVTFDSYGARGATVEIDPDAHAPADEALRPQFIGEQPR
jgi:hypothetical protein